MTSGMLGNACDGKSLSRRTAGPDMAQDYGFTMVHVKSRYVKVLDVRPASESLG